MELFEQSSQNSKWLDRAITALLFLGVAFCIYQPEMGIVKKWAQFAPQIAFSYWILGLLFMIFKRHRLMLFTFAACGFLCIYLKGISNNNLVAPKPTAEPQLKIGQFNLSSNNSTIEQALSIIRNAHLDVISLQEVTPDWRKGLVDSLHSLYPHRCNVATANFYSTELYSKFPFISCDTFYIEGVPSLVISIRSKPSARKVYILSQYLTPPLFNSAYATMRKQFDSVSVRLKNLKEPYITVGEYNTEGSSFEIQQFRHNATLLDSRRGFQPMRSDGSIGFSDVPTEHIFYTPHFQCIDFQTVSGAKAERLGIVGTYQFKLDSANVAK